MQIRWNKQWGIPAITGVSCFIAGTGVGYFVAHARLSKKVKEIEANQQLLRDHFSEMQKLANRQPPKAKMERTEAVIAEPEQEEEQVVAQHMHAQFEDAVLVQVEDSMPDPEEGDLYLVPADHSDTRIYAPEPDDDWDYDVEVPKRTDSKPYIIHRDEYFAEEAGFRQSTLTYYAGDNILCDEQDSPIYNHEGVIGHTLRFGHGSRDQSIVYIRNPLLQAEYEIVLENGYYQTEVLGAVIEDEMNSGDMKHSVFRYHKD